MTQESKFEGATEARFEGATEARLDALEKSNDKLWDKLNEIGDGVHEIKQTLATQKGFSMAMSAVVSAGISVVIAWLGFKKG